MRMATKAFVTALMIATFGSSDVNATTIDIYDAYPGNPSATPPIPPSPNYGPLSTYFGGRGYTVNQLTASFSSLSGANLVILSYPVGLGASQLSAIDSYVNGGGRLIINSDGQGFEDAQTAVNAILASLGSSIVNVDGAFDSGFHKTTNFISGPFTAGVTTINNAYTSEFTGGNALAYGVSDQVFIAYQQIGAGYVFAIADIKGLPR